MRTLTTLAAVALAGLALAGCGATGGTPLPQATDTAAAPAASAPKATTCDVAREAFLTGTVAAQTKALKALKADKTADATAREYAGYWLVRDAKQPDLRQMDQTLISSACSV